MTKSAKFRWAVALTTAGVLALLAAAIAQQVPGGGQRGFGGGAVVGTVATVDANIGVIGVQPQDGQGVWVAVTAETQMTKSVQAAPTDLQLGQTVTVRGQPTAITAHDIRIGEQAAPGRGERGAEREAEAGAGGPAPGEAPQGRERWMREVAVSGQVTNLNPLTLTTREDTAVAVTLAPNATVSQTMPVTLRDVVVGEQVVVLGQYAENGYYYARVVRIGETGRFGAGRPQRGQQIEAHQ